MKSTKFATWVSASRLRTLPLSLSGILVGSALALPDSFNGLSFSLCLILTILFQIISNLANDLGDGLKGTDNEHRVGPVRAFQSGALTQGELMTGIRLLSVISIIVTLILLFHAFGVEGWPWIGLFLFLALIAVWAGQRYTMGTGAYGYSGFGDLAVFLFFGLLAVLGTEFVLTRNLTSFSLWPAISVGLLSTSVLNLNNMRDVRNDRSQGKRTLVVRMGPVAARWYHYFLIMGSLCSWLCYLYLAKESVSTYGILWPYAALLVHIYKVYRTEDERQFDPELKKVALSTFLISLTFLIIKSAFA